MTTTSTVALATGIACALVAGVFFAFSGFVMRALGELPAGQGVAAMQAINRTALNPPLMLAMFGTAAACVVLVVLVLAGGAVSGTPRLLLLGGAALYLVGCVGVTIVGNVPLNVALAALDPTGADVAGRWAEFAGPWTAWNHVRTVACLAAGALLAAGAVGG